MDLSSLPDRAMLVKSLEADGWRVTQMGAGSIGYTAHGAKRTLAQGILVAQKGGSILNIGADGAGKLQTDAYDPSSITNRILQGYAREATIGTVQRFGFKLASETTLEDGTRALTFNRPMGAIGAKLGIGKVGL
jgi:hypothetical protein